MSEPLKIKCKEPGCTEKVEYVPERIPIVMALKKELEGVDLSDIPSIEFEKATLKVAASGIAQTSKEVELVCEKGHKHDYKVPK